MNEQRIWLIDIGDGFQAWCDSPDPEDGIDPEDVTGPYVLGADERIAALEADNKRLEAEIERLRKYADRYLWTRNHRVEVWDSEDDTLVFGSTPKEIDESYEVAMGEDNGA